MSQGGEIVQIRTRMKHLLDARMRLEKLSHGQTVLHVLLHPEFKRF